MAMDYLSSHISHHPKANGILEWWNAQLKAQLRRQLGANTGQVFIGLGRSLLGYSTCVESAVSVWELYLQ